LGDQIAPRKASVLHGARDEGFEGNHTMLIKHRDPQSVAFQHICATIKDFVEMSKHNPYFLGKLFISTRE
jgi:hypothetical protein